MLHLAEAKPDQERLQGDWTVVSAVKDNDDSSQDPFDQWTYTFKGNEILIRATRANGGLVEYHYPAVKVCEAIYGPLPAPQDGWLELPQASGLGFSPDPLRVKELAKLPTSKGKGKA